MIEMLVYIAVLVFMLVIILEVVFSVTKSERVIKAVRNVENSAALSLERISREARLAQSVNVASSTLGVHPGKLVLTGEDDAGNPRVVEFHLSNGQIWLKENGVEVGALSEGEAAVTNLIFHRFAGANSEGVRTLMTIESGTTTSYKSEKFYSSTVLR